MWAIVSTVGAAALAAFALWRRRLPAALRSPGRLLVPSLDALRGLHTGHVGDYVAWLTFGAAVPGGLLALGLS